MSGTLSATYNPDSTVYVNDLDPGAKYDSTTGNITLSNGSTIGSKDYTIKDSKAYVDKNLLLSSYNPTALTPEKMQGYIDTAKTAYAPTLTAGYDRLNQMIKTITGNVNSRIDSMNATASSANQA